MRSKPVMLELTAAEQATVTRILQATVPQAQVWAFGSRARGEARPYSDLDLLIDQGRPLSLREQAALAQAFDASDLPFRVDVVDATTLDPAMHARVRTEACLLHKASSSP